jgi:tellurite resistance protein
MALDWASIKEKAETFVSDASRTIKQYTPEAWSKEKKFVNAIVASMAIMTIADKKVDTREVTASMDMIYQIDQIAELEMQQEAIQLFEMHLEKLYPALESDVKWTIETAKLLGDIAKVKEYPDYVPMIKNLLDYIAQADNDFSPEEEEMKKKIYDILA